MMQALARGKLGVRSPLKKGRVITPFDPRGAWLTKPSNPAISVFSMRRANSVVTVQFMVHSRGNQPPLEEQNAAISPAGSITGWSAYA
jgi:hypothetical protein